MERSAATVEAIREEIRGMFERSPRVRLTVQMPHSRLSQEELCTITGVYPHVFCVEAPLGDTMQRHTYQYADVLTRRVGVEALG